MSEIEFKKGLVDSGEVAAYIRGLRDVREEGDFPKLMYRGEILIITDILDKFEGRNRVVTTDSKGRKKLFDISEPLFFDGTVFNLQNEYVEMDWVEYYHYWTSIKNDRPDVIRMGSKFYMVYSFTKVINEEGMYVVVGSSPNERITLKFDKDTVISRFRNANNTGVVWSVQNSPTVMEGRKWD